MNLQMISLLQQNPAPIPTNSINGNSSQIRVFLVVIVILFVVMMIVKIYWPFFKRVKYFKMEMKRSDGEEYYYWRSKLRKLYRKYIPFASLFIRKR